MHSTQLTISFLSKPPMASWSIMSVYEIVLNCSHEIDDEAIRYEGLFGQLLSKFWEFWAYQAPVWHYITYLGQTPHVKTCASTCQSMCLFHIRVSETELIFLFAVFFKCNSLPCYHIFLGFARLWIKWPALFTTLLSVWIFSELDACVAWMLIAHGCGLSLRIRDFPDVTGFHDSS